MAGAGGQARLTKTTCMTRGFRVYRDAFTRRDETRIPIVWRGGFDFLKFPIDQRAEKPIKSVPFCYFSPSRRVLFAVYRNVCPATPTGSPTCLSTFHPRLRGIGQHKQIYDMVIARCSRLNLAGGPPDTISSVVPGADKLLQSNNSNVTARILSCRHKYVFSTPGTGKRILFVLFRA